MPNAVQGACDPRFAQVRAEFEANFAHRGELGAGLCVVHEGRTVVDLWGGSRDAAGEQPWDADTLVLVWSCSKAATALCAHVLAGRGELDLDAPIARYWPQFGREGKAEIPVRMALNHQSGVIGISEPLPLEDLLDHEAMARRLERERPWWEPGTRFGYHGVTIGWLVGEIVRRVSGQSLGRFFRAEIAEPLGADFWIGLPEALEPRVAPTLLPETGYEGSSPFDDAVARGEPIQVAFLNALGPLFERYDERIAHAAENPGVNGIASARGLARMFEPLALGGARDGVELVDAEQLAAMSAVESAGASDAVQFLPYRFTTGFQKGHPGRCTPAFVLSESAFGHSGLGGSLGFADPEAKLAFGYAMNRHEYPAPGRALRFQHLVDATYRALGYSSRDSGRWI